ncbi:hypothetical protein BKA63DRAFT_497468 [Paraphoma chrysanthemicola]|nr:hypothetical protein BKA63DRAFT_497468 [Paraphoma chrysanthemicola]
MSPKRNRFCQASIKSGVRACRLIAKFPRPHQPDGVLARCMAHSHIKPDWSQQNSNLDYLTQNPPTAQDTPGTRSHEFLGNDQKHNDEGYLVEEYDDEEEVLDLHGGEVGAAHEKRGGKHAQGEQGGQNRYGNEPDVSNGRQDDGIETDNEEGEDEEDDALQARYDRSAGAARREWNKSLPASMDREGPVSHRNAPQASPSSSAHPPSPPTNTPHQARSRSRAPEGSPAHAFHRRANENLPILSNALGKERANDMVADMDRMSDLVAASAEGLQNLTNLLTMLADRLLDASLEERRADHETEARDAH